MPLRERDVNYVFDEDEAKELGFKLFKYEIWSHGVLACFETVHCRSKKDFGKLLEYWSRDTKWNYKEASEE